MNEESLRELLERFPLSDERPWLVVVDVGLVLDRFDELRGAFGEGWLHAVAMKANPLTALLRRLVDQGAGLEAASAGELQVALDAGCPPDRVVFDSPAKTRSELRRALDLGVTINADNLAEVERIAELRGDCGSRIGLRINPEVGAGTIEALSVATRNAKFGVSLEARRDEILHAFGRYDWLDGVHVHVGSQGCGLDLLVAGARRAVEVAEAVGARRIDIGGGLPFAYAPGTVAPSPADYAARLRRDVPALFDFDVTTEFGRWLFAPAGWAVSRVEYVKPGADLTIATVHFGADLMLRHVYQPGTWHHPISVFDRDGRRKTGAARPTTVAGPLCFSGDVIASDALLPPIDEGDVVTVSNIGAYTLSMWSHYCSRRFPTVVGVDGGNFVVLRPGDRVEDSARFWSD
jgi:diaminopimelate decarboxylase